MKRKHPAAVALGKLAKGHTSPAKAAASRENGKKGGRPRPRYITLSVPGRDDGDTRTAWFVFDTKTHRNVGPDRETFDVAREACREMNATERKQETQS